MAPPAPRAGGKRNTCDIPVQGDRLVLAHNSQTTVDVRNGKLASGAFALQWGRGTVKFRKVRIRPLRCEQTGAGRAALTIFTRRAQAAAESAEKPVVQHPIRAITVRPAAAP